MFEVLAPPLIVSTALRRVSARRRRQGLGKNLGPTSRKGLTVTSVAPSTVAVSSAVSPSRPLFMVVVVEYADAADLAIAAAKARHAGARLLIALARTRPSFTTDAVIARRIAVRAQEELRRLEQIAHLVLLCSGVDYDIVSMTYRSSGSPTKRERRIAAAASRLARRRGAIPLPASPSRVTLPSTPKTTSSAPSQPFSWASAQPAHVVAVLPDSAEAVRIAQTAGELAVASGRPLALVVPVPSTGFTLDPAVLATRYSRIEQDTDAIAGRVLPTLERLGLSARIIAAPYRTDGTSHRLYRGMAVATEEVAGRLRAEAVVLSAASPALPHMRIPAEVLHLVKPAAQDTSQDVAHPVPNRGRVLRPTTPVSPSRTAGQRDHV